MSDFYRDRKVLVTGAAGLVGGHLVRELIVRGANVVVLVRDFPSDSILFREQLVDEVELVHGDLLDQPKLERIINEDEIETVFHLAAQTTVPVANRNPLSTWEANVRGTYNVLESVRRVANRASVVVASTDKAYGEQQTMPTPEAARLNAVFPYDVSKACADMICRSYSVTFGTDVVVTRCGNLFGEGDLNWNRLVPGTIRSCLRGQPVKVRSDGSLVRDYLYVGDAVDGYLRLGELVDRDDDVAGQAFNISEEKAFDVLEMVDYIQTACGTQVRVDTNDERVQEIPSQHLDSSKIKRIAGWTPKFGIRRGMVRTVEWYKDLLS